jgi:hypothetical protein
MGYQNVISRQIHKRLSHHFTQAGFTQPYTILLSTVIRDFGLTAYEKLSHNLRDVETALKEMVSKNVLLSYKLDKITDDKRSNKMGDVKLTLYAHPEFVGEVISANKKQKDNLLLRQNPAQLQS